MELIRLGGPAHGIVTKTVHKILPGGGGGLVVCSEGPGDGWVGGWWDLWWVGSRGGGGLGVCGYGWWGPGVGG